MNLLTLLSYSSTKVLVPERYSFDFLQHASLRDPPISSQRSISKKVFEQSRILGGSKGFTYERTFCSDHPENVPIFPGPPGLPCHILRKYQRTPRRKKRSVSVKDPVQFCDESDIHARFEKKIYFVFTCTIESDTLSCIRYCAIHCAK